MSSQDIAALRNNPDFCRLLADEENIWKTLAGDTSRFCPSGVIVVSVVTSLIRALRYSSSKQSAIGLLYRIATGCSDSIVADRILPYLVRFTFTLEGRGALVIFRACVFVVPFEVEEVWYK